MTEDEIISLYREGWQYAISGDTSYLDGDIENPIFQLGHDECDGFRMPDNKTILEKAIAITNEVH